MSTVLGMGLDLASIERIADSIKGKHGHKFVERVFLPREQALCEARKDRYAAYAARFAAKEAFVKALGVPKGISWLHIEVVRGTGGAPALKLTGRAAQVMKKLKARALLTLSHDAGVAAAVVLIVSQR